MNISFSWSKLALTIVIILMLGNLAYLDYSLVIREQVKAPLVTSVQQKTDVSFPVNISPSSSDAAKLANYQDLLSIVKEATASVTQKVDQLLVSQYPQKTVNVTTPAVKQLREYYIPLGTGLTTASEWTDINGCEAYLAPGNYGQIKEMYFEAAARVATGRVYIRLKNVTDNIGLFESEIYREGVNGSMISSGKIPVPVTTKLYRVQMKSTLGDSAVLDNARIKIFAE